MHPSTHDLATTLNRRSFLNRSTTGIGAVALASLLKKWTGVIRKPHHPAKAKRVIHLCMAGGPSHLETLDYKPKLAEMNGKPMPKSITEGQPIAQLQNNKNLTCLGPQHEFKNFGESGQHISSILPNIGSVADAGRYRLRITPFAKDRMGMSFVSSGSKELLTARLGF